MVVDSLISSAGFPLLGGGALGFGVGYLLKKLLKVAIIIMGAIVLLIGYFEYQKWILVNWTIVENQTSTMMTHTINKITTVTQNMGHEIPIGIGLLGFAPGVLLGFYKG
jgi:uncharacterized membrane protein (Fun14 family)